MTPVTRESQPINGAESACPPRADSADEFAQWVDLHGPSLLRFLRRRCPDAHTAEDLLQETFLRAWKHRVRYDLRWTHRAWLLTIASRLATDHWRRKRPDRLVHEELLASAETDPAEAVEGDEQARRIWRRARETLSAAQFEAIALHYGEGLDTAQTARVMRRTRTGVKVLLFRARARLADVLATPRAQTDHTRATPIAQTGR